MVNRYTDFSFRLKGFQSKGRLSKGFKTTGLLLIGLPWTGRLSMGILSKGLPWTGFLLTGFLLMGLSACGTGGDLSREECPSPLSGSTVLNPLFPDLYTADPAVLVHNCTFYITAGHDEGETEFQMFNWYVLSSTDLVHWSDNGGPVLSLDVFEWADANAWAGQMVEKDGRFYWYEPVNKGDGSGMAIGVAVGDSPLGPFVDAIGAPLIDDRIEMEAFDFEFDYQTVFTIDPTVFVDDDGRAYLSYGGFGRMVTVELGSDMVSLAGDLVEETPEHIFEAPYLFTRGGIYYVIYAAGINPATIDYSVSESPFGPWRYQGRIMDALPNLPGEDFSTSHPAVAEFAGQWYLVYHISDGPGGGTYKRQVALEKLYFDPDGHIAPISPSKELAF